jgi:hypothetical protein
MSNIVAAQRSEVMTQQAGSRLATRPTRKSLARLEQRTLVRLANIQTESYVQTEKIREVGHVAREAMTDQAMLHGWAKTLAAGDPLLQEDLRFFLDMARLGKGEILADLVETYCRESRS